MSVLRILTAVTWTTPTAQPGNVYASVATNTTKAKIAVRSQIALNSQAPQPLHLVVPRNQVNTENHALSRKTARAH